MKSYKTLMPILAIILFCSCSKKENTKKNNNPNTNNTTLQIDGNKAFAEVKSFVSLGARDSGTEGAKQAATYIASSLKELGIDPLIDEFSDDIGSDKITFRNITGIIHGTKRKTVIIASHYDTKSGISDDFIGANDSGSSTGLLLALAAKLKTQPPMPYDIILAFLDGEECIKLYNSTDGLHGSRHLAATLASNKIADRVLAVIILDMIGDKNLNISIPRNSTPKLISLVFDAAHAVGSRQHFSLSDSMILDDHVPFLRAGMPAIDLIDFKFGSTPEKNDYWHTTNDTMDKLSAESLKITGNVVLEMLSQMAK